MDTAEMDHLAGEVDALAAALDGERFRHVAGLEAEPALAPLFAARGRAAHRETVAALRARGEDALADVVAALRAERAAAEDEEAWRAADAAAVAQGPDGPLPLSRALLLVPREQDRDRRRALSRAAAQALAGAGPRREAAAEVRARARAEVGLVPDWKRVVEADQLEPLKAVPVRPTAVPACVALSPPPPAASRSSTVPESAPASTGSASAGAVTVVPATAVAVVWRTWKLGFRAVSV